jgi:transposase InsO family protein
VRLDLQGLGQRCGKNRISRLMRESGLRPKAPPFGDLAPRDWQGDFANLETAGGRLDLAFTLDACTRRCVAHHCRPHMCGELTAATHDLT